MFEFRGKSCNAFAWNDDGMMTGVRLLRQGDGARVVGYWQEQRSEDRGDAELLARGSAALGGGQDSICMVGGDAGRSSFVDLDMPDLPPEDLRRALEFDLGRYSPLPPERVRWGYRLLGQNEQTNTQRVRVAFIRDDDWNAWSEACSGIRRGVDMLIPAPVALDPALSNRDVQIQTGDDGSFLLTRNEQDLRAQEFGDDETAFGGGDSPLEDENLDIGDLASLAPTEQRRFVPAIVLGLYGLTRAPAKDRQTWLKLPAGMQPQRHRLLKAWAWAACLLLVLVAALFVGRWGMALYQQHEARRQESAAIRREIADIEQRTRDSAVVISLADELQGLLSERQSLGRNLAEITARLDESIYTQDLTYEEDRDSSGKRITLHLRSDAEHEDIAAELTQTTRFTDFEYKVEPRREGTIYTVSFASFAIGEQPELPGPLPPPSRPEPEAEDAEEDETVLDEAAEIFPEAEDEFLTPINDDAFVPVDNLDDPLDIQEQELIIEERRLELQERKLEQEGEEFGAPPPPPTVMP